MKLNLNFRKRTFDEVYGTGLNPETPTPKEYNSVTLKPTSANVYVHDCVFRSCLSTSNGGALYCSGSVIRLLVEQSSFISCKTSSSNGGGIYFSNTNNGECVLSKLCAFDCLSTTTGNSYGMFARIETKNKNNVNESSVTHSYEMNANSQDGLRLHCDNILCPFINITHSVCYWDTAIELFPKAITGTVTGCISYCSIVNNTARDYGIVVPYCSDSLQVIDTCNILNNKQDGSDYAIIYSPGDVHIKDSCILGNGKGKKVFYVYASYTMTISNCTIDNDIESGRTYGNVIINKTIERTFINALSHIATQNCDSYFDSYGTLTVNPIVASKSSRCLLSCDYKYPMIDGLGRFEFMFLLTFLPSDTTNYDIF